MNLHVLLVYFRVKKIEVSSPVVAQLPTTPEKVIFWWLTWQHDGSGYEMSVTPHYFIFFFGPVLKAIFPLDACVVLTASFMPNLRTTHLSPPRTRGKLPFWNVKAQCYCPNTLQSTLWRSSLFLSSSPFPLPFFLSTPFLTHAHI